MEVNLLRSVKLRVMDELRLSVQNHQVYKDKVNVYHKFPYKERPMMGVLLRNASGNRVKLSADDHAGTLKSHLALARAENREDSFLSWVWEDRYHTTNYVYQEDMSSQIEGSATFGENRIFHTQHKPLLFGENNTNIANNVGQVIVTVNGNPVLPDGIDGISGTIILSQAPVLGDQVLITYFYPNMTPPGRYYIEMITTTQFVIDPLYFVKAEKVIECTTGTELTAQLDNGGLYGDFDSLYTLKTPSSIKMPLEKGTDYTIDTAGLITLLSPLTADTTLYADYRWAGSRMGPFDVPKEFHYVNNALPGVTLAFSNQLNAGSRMVVIVYPDREPAAEVRSGHFNMTFEIEVFTRDPQQLADLTDHIVNEVWNNRRLLLMDEGLTITDMEPTGESEDTYDSNTGDLYYKNSITLQLMSEWKKFIPYLYDLRDFDIRIQTYAKFYEYIVTNQNQIMETRLKAYSQPFEIKYPMKGYPRYF